MIRSGVKWSSHGECNNKYYLTKASQRKSSARLNQVQSAKGSLSQNSTETSSYVFDFYSKLYASSPHPHSNISSFISSSGPPCESFNVFSPIKTNEVIEAIKFSSRNKSPGPDGIPFEVYRNFSPLLAPILTNLFNTCLANTELLPGSEESIVITLYKKGDKTNLANWRPIALSNTDLKLLTKILANRLNPHASKVLSQNQYGFIQGRNIHDNINLVANVLREPKAEGSLCFLDQEKAYDRIDWEYLGSCLTHYGICNEFILWIKKFFQSSYLSVIGKEFKTNPIFPGRGLRQGDPMSPILYNFAINPLLNHLNSLSGISLPGQPPLKVLAFADDCVLGIKDNKDCALATSIFKSFEKASQAKLNANKSEAIAKCNAPSKLPFNIQYSPNPIRHLGILVGPNGVSTSNMEEQLLKKMQDRIAMWTNTKPSIKGKVLLFNVFVSSKLWYATQHFPISSSFESQIRTLFNSWLWRSKTPPISTLSLTIKTKFGGLSLLDPIAQANKMFSIWIAEVLNPDYKTPSWQFAARIQWAKALNLRNPTHYTTLFSYLAHHPKPRGPLFLTGFWRQILGFYRVNNFSVSYSLSQENRGFPSMKFNTSQTPRELMSTPSTPRVFSLQPSNQYNLSKIWNHCHSPFVPPSWNSHCWRVLQTAYRTSERTSLDIKCKSCNNNDTLMHRYFKCQYVTPIWNTLNSIFPDSYPINGNHVNWFYEAKSTFINEDIRVIMFLTALWSIHTAFIENLNSATSTYNLPLLRFSANISTTFQNLLFGSNWPQPLHQRIKSWTNLWFLKISSASKTVTLTPVFSTLIPNTSEITPTDRPPDNPPSSYSQS